MKEEIDLKRQMQRKAIRRQQINLIVKTKRENMIQEQGKSLAWMDIGQRIYSSRSSPYSEQNTKAILHDLQLVKSDVLGEPTVLKYLESLLEPSCSAQITDLISRLMWRYLQNQKYSASENRQTVLSILKNLRMVDLYSPLSDSKGEIKRYAYMYLTKLLEEIPPQQLRQHELGSTFFNFIIHEPQIVFTQATKMCRTLNIVVQTISEVELKFYMMCILETFSQSYSIPVMLSMGNLYENITNRLEYTQDTELIKIIVKFVASMFRAKQALFKQVEAANPYILKLLTNKLGTVSDQVSAWVLFAMCNYFASKPISSILKTDILVKVLGCYNNGSNRTKDQSIILCYILCHLAEDRVRMILFESQVLTIVMQHLKTDPRPDMLMKCLRIMEQMLGSSLKLDSLEMSYSKVIKANIISYGMLPKLQELITHGSNEISMKANDLLNEYFTNVSPF